MIGRGRNPARRSRKIGATQGGRVQGGRATEKRSRIFTNDIWDQLSERSGDCLVLRENPSRNYIHPCSGDEYLGVLAELPHEMAAPVRAIVLRRLPKLDERRGVEARKRYLCVILNSFPATLEMRWRKPPTDGIRSHYNPWCSSWVGKDDSWTLAWTSEELRRYYKYHLLLHEVGHLHGPWSNEKRVREAFAESFALEWARKLGQL